MLLLLFSLKSLPLHSCEDAAFFFNYYSFLLEFALRVWQRWFICC